MIQITLFLPLVVGGIATALWREHRRKQKQTMILSPDLTKLSLPPNEQESSEISNKVVIIDDAAEISHNQRVSLIALALSGSGTLVYPPFTLASIPLLSYSTFYFLNTIRRSNPKQRKSALTIFEVASVAGTLLTGRVLLLSSLLAFSFSTRKWGLQAGNISTIGMGKAFDPNFRKVWVRRGDAEVEVTLSDLQPDDVAVLHTGDIIRMNGDVVEGEGIVKQCSLTGILQAIPKKAGDPVFSYTEVAAGDLFVKYV